MLRPLLETILLDPQSCALVQKADGKTTVFLKDAAKPEVRKEEFDAPFAALSTGDRARLAALCAKRELRLSLSAADVLLLNLEMPKKALGNLTKAVTYRLLTESPIRPESTVFDAKAMPAGPGQNGHLLVIAVALCRRQVVERLKLDVEPLGLAVDEIGFSREEGVELEYRFQRLGSRRTIAARLRRNLLLAIGPVLIFVLALSGIRAHSQRQEGAIRKDIQSISTRTEESVRLLARRAYARGVSKALNDGMPGVALSQLLNDISKALPESAWLLEIRLDHGKVKLVGNGADPTAAAKAISAVPGLAAVRLESVTSLPHIATAQRFEIAADISMGRGK